jgi:CheY-like chemotaxis protein
MSPQLNTKVIPLSEVPWRNAVYLTGPQRPVLLVVDDERIIADTLSLILSRNGYEVMTAYDGMGALELVSGLAPDLVITDVVMPGMTGIELAITLRKTIPTCKVLLFSGQAATIDLLDEAHLAGEDFAILAKPVPPAQMLRRVSECLTTSSDGKAFAGDNGPVIPAVLR